MAFLKNYTVRLTLVSLIAFALSLALYQSGLSFFATPYFYIATLFFAVTTVLTNLVFTKGDKQSKEFIMKIMALSMGRLLVCMIFVFVFSRINKPQALAFACHFMLQYILFTIFEITSVLKYIKQ